MVTIANYLAILTSNCRQRGHPNQEASPRSVCDRCCIGGKGFQRAAAPTATCRSKGVMQQASFFR